MSKFVIALLTLVYAQQSVVLETNTDRIDPIEVSDTTQDTTAIYYFNLRSPVQLLKNSYLYIEFPQEYETVTTTAVKYVIGYGTGNVLETTATFSLTASTLTITIPVTIAADYNFTIQVEGCKNPQDLTNTGPFKLYTRKEYDITNQTENWTFGTLSFTPTYSSYPGLIDVIYSGFDHVRTHQTNYYMFVQLRKNIDAGTWFRLLLPSGWSKASETQDLDCAIIDVGFNSPISGTHFCRTDGSYVYLQGLGEYLEAADTDKSNLVLKFAGIINPSYAISPNTQTFTMDVIHEGTVNIIEQFTAGNPEITQGPITLTANTGPNGQGEIVPGNQIVYKFGFENERHMEEGGKVTITLSDSTFVSSASDFIGCWPITGLSPKSDGTYPTCTVSTQTITIENFAQQVGTIAEIQVIANILIAGGTRELITIKTFTAANAEVDELEFEGMVREASNKSIFSYFDVVPAASQSNETGQTITVSFRPTLTIPIGASVSFYVKETFVAAAGMTCVYDPAAGGANQTQGSCAYSTTNGEVYSTVVQAIPHTDDTAWEQLIYGPFDFPVEPSTYSNVYEYCLQIRSGSSTDYINTQCMPAKLAPYTLTALNNLIVMEANTANLYMPFTFNYQADFAITPPASEMQVRYYLPTAMAGPVNAFAVDAGVTTGNLSCTFSGTSVINACAITATSVISTTNFVLITLTVDAVLTTNQYARMVLKSPAQTWDYKVEVGYEKNYDWFPIQEVLQSLAADITLSATDVSATAAQWTTNPPNLITRNNLAINGSTTIIADLQPKSNSAANAPFWVIMPTEWDISTVTGVSIEDGDPVSDLTLYNNDYAPLIYCKIVTASDLGTGAEKEVSISGMSNPSAVGIGTGVPITAVLADGTPDIVAYGATTNLSPSTGIPITTYTITPSIITLNTLGVDYDFQFTIVSAIPDDGQFAVTFASAYTLGSTVYAELITDLTASDGNEVTITVTTGTRDIVVSHLGFLAAGSQVDLRVYRIDNPAGTVTPNDFNLRTMNSAGQNIDIISNAETTLAGTFTSAVAYFEKIEMIPNTRLAEFADLITTVVMPNMTPHGATVQVSLPSDFDEVATTSCSANYKYTSCTANGLFINLVLGESVPANLDLKIKVRNIVTVPDVSETRSFSIITTYSGTTLDQSVQNGVQQDGRDKLYPTSEIDSFTVQEIDFLPKNEGEPSTYTFTLIAPISVVSTEKFWIWFPDNFGPILHNSNDDIECWATPANFVGNLINCYLIDDYLVEITGHSELQANLQFSINLASIYNPVAGKLGKFKFAIVNTDGTIKYYQTKSGNLSTSEKPGTLNYRDMTYTEPYARVSNTWTWDFTPSANIPSDDDKGSVFIDLPEEFVLKNLGEENGWEYTCETSLFVDMVLSTTNWNDNVKCFNYNSNRIVVTGGNLFLASTTKMIRITILELKGPQTTTQTHNVRISTYNGVTKDLIDTTYSTLAYPDTLTLPLNGEELVLQNADDIIVIRGTTNYGITIQVADTEYPMRTDLSLSGSLPKVKEAKIHPANNLVFPTGETSLTFGISIPHDLTPGTYSLEWSKSGDDFESLVAYDEIYSPLKNTNVKVTIDKATITISQIGTMVGIGHSHFVTCTLSNGPHEELIITPSVESLDSGIVFVPSTFTFASGVSEIEFMIYATTNVLSAEHTISFELSGNDAGSYQQPADIDFNVKGADSTAPTFGPLTYTVTRNTVNFNIHDVDEEGIFYFLIELKDYPVPTAQEILTLWGEGKAMRRNVFAAVSDFQFSVDSLAAETTYVIYVVLQDLGDNVSEIRQSDFKTAPDYFSVRFVIDFDRFNPSTEAQNDNFIQNVIIKELGHALSVIPERLSAESITSYARRRLQATNEIESGDYSDNALVISLANDKYSTQASPLEIASKLTLAEVNRWFSRHADINAVQLGQPASLANDIPNWQLDGMLWDATDESLTVSGHTTAAAWIHMVVLENDALAPSAQQVAWGLDANNDYTKHASLKDDGSSTQIYVTLTGLEADKLYSVFIAIESDYPGNNKEVFDQVIEYRNVATDAGNDCNPCSDPYMLADDFAYALACLVLALLV